MAATNQSDVTLILSEELNTLKDVIARNLDEKGISASGKTRDSLEAIAEGTGGTLYGRGFFAVTETGRKGGKVPKGFRLVIEQWAKDKGISFDSPRDLKSFSYFVARKIAREGTKQFREGRRTDVYTEATDIAAKNIANRLGFLFSTEVITLNDINEKYI